jgi:succinate dehydrogenase flavoprotein subunit
MTRALERIAALKDRVAALSVEGHRQYNPGWHLALDLPHMLVVSECIARAALEREESRGGHTRDDFPAADAEWARTNLVCAATEDGGVAVTRRPLPQMPPELAEIFEEAPA